MKNRIRSKIIFYIIAFSSIVAILATGIQLYREYSNDIDGVHNRFAQIELSYLPSIAEAAWIRDLQQLKALAEGIHSHRDILWVDISDGKETLAAVGARPVENTMEASYDILYRYRGTNQKIGHLTVVAGLSDIYWRLLDRVVTILVSNGVKTFLVAIFAYFLLTRVVTRHLETIAAHFQKLGPQDLGRELRLDRPQSRDGEPDELDLVVSAFGNLQERLANSYRALEDNRAELIASEQRYRQILDDMIDTYYRTDAEGRLVMISPSGRDLLGYAPAEIVGKNLADIYAEPGERAVFLRALKERKGEITGYEVALKHKDGHIVWVSSSTRMLTAPDGKFLGVEGVARNITNRRAAADALREREAQVRAVADAVPAMIIYVDDNAQIRFANSTVATWFARPLERIVGRDMRTLADPSVYKTLGRFFDSALEGIAQKFEHWATFPDGHRRLVENTFVPHRRPDGTTSGFFALTIDLTERHNLEERLRQSQKMEAVGQLTGGVAHDFNNILGVIVGNAELMQEIAEGRLEVEGGLVANAERYLEAILRTAEQGASLTKQLLAFSRKQALAPQVVDLNDVVDEVVQLLNRTLGETVALDIVHEKGLRRCKVDRAQLENAILNLAINSRDAMPNGGKLTIETRNVDLNDESVVRKFELEPGQYLMLSISDTGIGIPAKDLERVFEPFFTTKGAGEGTGLGLSMVYGFVKQSGGHVSLSSEVGKGTRVEIYLPSTELRVAALHADVPAARLTGTGLTVMVVEDDADLRMLATVQLRQLGFEVLECADGASAMETIMGTPRVDLLLSDVMLPGGMLGPELAEQVKAQYPGVKIVFMTGYAEHSAVRRSQLDAGVAVLEKPFRRQQLIDALNVALSQLN